MFSVKKKNKEGVILVKKKIDTRKNGEHRHFNATKTIDSSSLVLTKH